MGIYFLLLPRQGWGWVFAHGGSGGGGEIAEGDQNEAPAGVRGGLFG